MSLPLVFQAGVRLVSEQPKTKTDPMRSRDAGRLAFPGKASPVPDLRRTAREPTLE
jgi:hypothetical protein